MGEFQNQAGLDWSLLKYALTAQTSMAPEECAPRKAGDNLRAHRTLAIGVSKSLSAVEVIVRRR